MQMIEDAISPAALEAFKDLEREPKNRHERRLAERDERLAERERVLAVLVGPSHE